MMLPILEASGTVVGVAVMAYMGAIAIASMVGSLHSDAARRSDATKVLRLLLSPLHRTRR
jgi:hypothetical protein